MSPSTAAAIVAIALALVIVMAGGGKRGARAVRSIALVATGILLMAAMLAVLVGRAAG